MTVPVLTLLYVPADRPDRVVKALESDADVVLVDLEDAVAPTHKDAARAHAARVLGEVKRPVQVRINHRSTQWHEADLAAVAALPPAVGLRVPKVESAEEITRLAEVLPDRDLHVLVESALGVERAFDIATAAPQVASLGMGEADLRSDLRLSDEAGLLWARGRVVNAARAAGLPSPAMSAYPHIQDLDGLEASCRSGRALGFLGRSAIHPAQLPRIRVAFMPSRDEIDRARAVVERVGDARTSGVAAASLDDGTFLDIAMVEQAQAVLAIAHHARQSTDESGPPG